MNRSAVHRLGPEFDFPLLAPMQFVGLGRPPDRLLDAVRD